MEGAAPKYEFDTEENVLIDDLSSKMSFVSYFLFAMAGVYALVAIGSLQESGIFSTIWVLNGGVPLLAGLWTKKAAGSFQMIVDTQGSDIGHLLRALGELKKMYTLAFWLLIAYLALFVLFFMLIFVTYGIGAGGGY